MRELEDRLGEVLRRGAGEPGHDAVAGLAPGARGRLRRRRRTQVVAGAVTTAVVAVGIAATSGALRIEAGPPVAGQDGQDGGTPPGVEVTEVPGDWRFTSYGPIEIAVPPAWREGSMRTWCTAGESPEEVAPAVQRPGGVELAIACPSSGYGVIIGEDLGLEPPAGAAVEATEMAGIALTVVAPDAETARTVAMSVREVDVDVHGCAASVAVPELGAMSDAGAETGAATGAVAGDGPVALCLYGTTGEGANRLFSATLPDQEAEALLAAVDRLRPGTGPDADPSQCAGWEAESAVLVRAGAEDLAWLHTGGCDGHGVDVRGTTYRLDASITRWAQPLPGGTDGSVPVPADGFWQP